MAKTEGALKDPSTETPAQGNDAASGEPASVTAEEAAKILGVSIWTLYAAVNRGEVPHRRIGRRMLFSRRALVLWLECASPRDAGKG